jgi:hypothetical protein
MTNPDHMLIGPNARLAYVPVDHGTDRRARPAPTKYYPPPEQSILVDIFYIGCYKVITEGITNQNSPTF